VKRKAEGVSSILIILIALGIFITAVSRSTVFKTDVGPSITVSSISKRLTETHKTTNKNVKPAKTKFSDIKSSSNNSSSKYPSASLAPTSSLTNTGPGNLIIVFTSASIVGTILYYLRLRLYIPNQDSARIL
jgi:hypothetical protein